MSSSFYLLTVTGKDQSGIIARVTEVLFKHHANLEDVSMTILEGEFAMILVMALPSLKVKPAIEKDFLGLGKKTGLVFSWKVFGAKPVRGSKHEKGSARYLIRAIGPDRTGIVYKISRLLAAHRLNITDLSSRILGRGKQAIYALVLEVDISKSFPVSKVKKALAQLGSQLGIDLQLRAVEAIEF